MRARGWIAMAMLGLALSAGTGCTTGDALSTPTFAAPEWAPPYASGARYYYMPDMEVYYDAYTGNFVFWDGFDWALAPSLPSAYRYHDLYNANIILLDTRVNDPWLYHNHYITRYPKGYYHGPRTNPGTNTPSGNYPSRVHDENENKADLPSNPRGIGPGKSIPQRSIQKPRQQPLEQPGIKERPQIKMAPREKQALPPSQPKQSAPQPNKAPAPKAGQGKGG